MRLFIGQNAATALSCDAELSRRGIDVAPTVIRRGSVEAGKPSEPSGAREGIEQAPAEERDHPEGGEAIQRLGAQGGVVEVFDGEDR